VGGVTVSCPRSKSKRRSKGGVLTQNARQMTHEIKKRMGAKTRLLNVFRALYLSADRRGWLSPHTCGRWRRSPRVQRALNQDQHCRRQQHCTAPTPAPRWRPYIYIYQRGRSVGALCKAGNTPGASWHEGSRCAGHRSPSSERGCTRTRGVHVQARNASSLRRAHTEITHIRALRVFFLRPGLNNTDDTQRSVWQTRTCARIWS
jgi:hypothetical protein